MKLQTESDYVIYLAGNYDLNLINIDRNVPIAGLMFPTPSTQW